MSPVAGQGLSAKTVSVEMLLEKARQYLPEDMLAKIAEAYQFAAAAHDGQTRRSGEPFVEHPLSTAIFLADLRLDHTSLVAALLHDVMEDCGVRFDELERRFGTDVAKLVDGVTKLTKTELLTDDRGSFEGQPEDELARAATIRKMLMSMAEDIRVVLIKLADRLHNMRTLKALPKPRRTAIAQETLDIYAPLAHRLGIWEIKWRLEDLAFQHLNPAAYKSISSMLRTRRVEREKYIERVIGILRSDLEAAGVEDPEITGRPKHIYSIHKKVQKYAEQNREIGEIYDLFALRVLVKDIPQVYAALGTVHARWRPLPGQFDDYIANPKDNLYKSLHTTVLCLDACPVEVQIRTHEMHYLAEYGVAAHWLYKEGEAVDPQFDEEMTGLRQMLEWQRDVGGAEEFVESFKTDIFKNQVFVYTPKGDLKELPAGSTPLDFAYRIHTDIGNRCIGGKVNGKLVPLHYKLRNGDSVQILTSKTIRGPSLDWLNPNLEYVKTTSARAKIRQWFNKQARTVNVQRGREIFNKQVRRLSPDLDEAKVAKLMSLGSPDELLAALGSGTVTTAQVVERLSVKRVKPQERGNQVALPSLGPASGVEVLGVGDLLTRIARCCSPIRGDQIVGYITRTRGVTVHQNGCPNVTGASEAERIIGVDWGRAQTLYPVRIRIEAVDRVGLLRDLTAVVSEERVNIASCVSEEYDEVSIVSLTVYINGIDQLNRLFSKVEGVKGVMTAARVMG